MNKLLPIVLIVAVITLSCQPMYKPTDYINPIIGAVTYAKVTDNIHGFGKTFPGTATPFGLVQLSPDTYTGGDNGCGYSFEHKTIEGFSFTHMSGVGWYGDLGNFLVMPTTGELNVFKGLPDVPDEGYRSRFSHDRESCSAGYYAVDLDDYGIRTELSCAPRAGIMRMTYPEHKLSRIQIDLARRVGGTSTEQYIKVINEHTVAGWMKCPPEGGGWGNGHGKADYTVFFYCQIDQPIHDFGIWSAHIPDSAVRKNREINSPEYRQWIEQSAVYAEKNEMQGKHLGFYLNFPTKAGDQVVLKTGISFVSIEGAKENLDNDIPHWDFDQVHRENKAAWNLALKDLEISGGSDDQKTIFYTALYHTMIDPRAFSDVNGQYIGADNQVHEVNDFIYRTIFSGWDVFRSQFPLQTLINPELVNDEINSLMQMAELSGNEYYPRWEFLNSYSGCMLGNPAVSVLLDAFQKGIRNYDIEKAFRYAKNSVDTFANNPEGFTPRSTSKTLEYAYSDWCLAEFAQALGKESLAAEYYVKSKSYSSIWDSEMKWFRARDQEENWIPWKGKTVHGQGCTESNPYQQGWFVPHDYPGLEKLMGGREKLLNELIPFFENVPENFLWNNYYNHPNEPVHHVPFLFNEAGRPDLTQYWTRKICEKAYGIDAFGLCGNEDVGQMSAWYVLAAIGLHPICPGDNKWQITSPVFDKITNRKRLHPIKKIER